MNAAPDSPPHKGPGPAPPPEPSRRKQIEALGLLVGTPPIPWAGHIVNYLFEFGPVKADAPLEPVDIQGIEHVLEVKLKPWEKRLLLELSRAYKGEMHTATSRDAPAPWQGGAWQWRRVQQKRSNDNLEVAFKQGLARNGNRK